MRRTCVIAMLLLLVISAARAQDVPTVLIGGGVEWMGGWPLNAAVPFYPGGSECGEFGSGTTSFVHAGISLALPSLLGNNWGASFTLGWEPATTRFAATPGDTSWGFDAALNRGVVVETEQRLTLRNDRLALGLLLRNDPLDRLAVEGGVIAGVNLSGSAEQTEVHLDDYRFPDGSDTRGVGDGIPFTSRDVSLALALSLSTRIALGGRLWFVPRLTGRVDLFSPVNEANWTTITLGGGASLMFDPTPRSDTIPPPPPPLAADTSRTVDSVSSSASSVAATQRDTLGRSRLDAAIDIYAIGEGGEKLSTATVRVFEVVQRRLDAGVRTLYFGEGSSQLPQGNTPMVLDSLADELLVSPSSRVTLLGSRSPDEPAALARERARVVRDYLSRRGIAPTRIEIAGATSAPRTAGRVGDELAASRYVAIESDVYWREDRVVSEQVEREYEPPSLKLEPRIEAPAGVRQWTIQLLHNGQQIARYSSDPDDTLASRRIDWRIDAEGETQRRSLLVAALTVEDSVGNTATSRSQIPLFIERNVRVVERTEAGIDGREHITWSLLSFSGSAARPGDRNEEILAEIAEAIRSGAHVTVVGYGDDGRLPRRRADAVAALLRGLVRESGRRNVQITAEVNSPSDASAYTSPVDIQVDQPVGE